MNQTFTKEDIELLSKTVEALSAYMGKPVLAEIDVTEEGYEWIAFGTPLEVNQDVDPEAVIMQMGGPSARLIGASALLEDFNRSIYNCEFLWGIQVGEPPLTYTRIDYHGEEVDWSDDISLLLPFGMTDTDLIEEMALQDKLDDYGEFDDDDLDEDNAEESASQPNKGTYLGRKIWH
ncbi:hypothetical protein F9B74_09730 [Pelistega sp. NLN82]|uniref:Uncharacterized protein n=1 Tax=Pelistega ratti TaxID=2652177 RepID=A0A6L9Y8G3_9BURK|nr:hypothetical protein [Pelistega ratti]NEN76583.1 hypothetical protein [Pelistega ratti]